MVLVRASRTTVKFSDIAATWRQWEQLNQGTGIYQQRSSAAYVSTVRDEGSAVRSARQHMEDRGSRDDSREAKSTPSPNGGREKGSKWMEGEYKQFHVRPKKDCSPPDIPPQAILQDGLYWVQRKFDFRRFFESLKGAKSLEQGEGKDRAMATREAESVEKAHITAAAATKKEETRGGEEVSQEKCQVARASDVGGCTTILPLVVDSACTMSIVRDPKSPGEDGSE